MIWGFGLIGLVGYVALVIFGSRWSKPRTGALPMSQPSKSYRAADTLTVTSWNLGFAGLGAKADFKIDGGRYLRPLSRGEISTAAQGIAQRLQELDSDINLLQESAGPSFLTRGVNLRHILTAAFSEQGASHWTDFASRFVPLPLKFDHGMSVFSRLTHSGCSAILLPQDDSYHVEFLKKYYGAMRLVVPGAEAGADWVFYNIHLSAYDKGAAARHAQMKAVMEQVITDYEAGCAVIIGGDWNMRVADTEFPHDTPPAQTHLMSEIPRSMLPDGWRLVVDPATPTVRTLSTPFERGKNGMSIIDGFVVSPNVSVLSVKTVDLNFEHTDHHPVTARFALR